MVYVKIGVLKLQFLFKKWRILVKATPSMNYVKSVYMTLWINDDMAETTENLSNQSLRAKRAENLLFSIRSKPFFLHFNNILK